jgi:hypothetical protein
MPIVYPNPPRSLPFAICFNVSPDKKKIQAHCIRFESYIVEGPGMVDTKFTLLHHDTKDKRVDDLVRYIKANWKDDA